MKRGLGYVNRSFNGKRKVCLILVIFFFKRFFLGNSIEVSFIRNWFKLSNFV